MAWTTTEPSPTAEATRFTEPLRTSPNRELTSESASATPAIVDRPNPHHVLKTGGDGFHPGPAPLDRRRPVQLQRTRPKRLCLRRYPIQASVDQASDRRRAVPNLIKESSMATLSQLINAKAITIAKLAVRATTAAGSGRTLARSEPLGGRLPRFNRRSLKL